MRYFPSQKGRDASRGHRSDGRLGSLIPAGWSAGSCSGPGAALHCACTQAISPVSRASAPSGGQRLLGAEPVEADHALRGAIDTGDALRPARLIRQASLARAGLAAALGARLSVALRLVHARLAGA